MYTHLLIATDGSDIARKAVGQGLALAKALGARATVITVTEPWLVMVIPEAAAVLSREDYEEIVASGAAQILAEADEASRKAGMPCETLHVKDRYPAEGITETAAQKGCDLIVMASHGRRGLRRLALGSVASEVVTHSPVPVLICR